MNTLLIVLSVIVSALVGIFSNILSGFLQPEMMRWRKAIISIVIFLIALAICIGILQSDVDAVDQSRNKPFTKSIVDVDDVSLLSSVIHIEWKDIYADNFSDNTLNLWSPLVASNGAAVNPIIKNGSFEIKVTTTDWAYQEAFFRSFFNSSDDFEISVDAALVAKFGCGYGIAFRGDPSGNYYVFGLQSSNSYETDIRYFVAEVTPGLEQKRRVLITSPLSETIGIPQSLKVISIGNKFFFFVNDRFVDDLDQEQGKRTIRGSGFGLEVLVCPGMTETFVFKNFVLYVPLETDSEIRISDLEKAIPTSLPHPSLVEDNLASLNFVLINKINSHDLSTDNSFLSVIPNPDFLSGFKISGRFHNPLEGETRSWSYGFSIQFKNGDWMNVLVRSDSLWAIAYYENRSGRYLHPNFGVLNNLNTGYKESNDLEMIHFQNSVKFTVNGVEIFTGENNFISANISDVGIAVALDDERDHAYLVPSESIKLWKTP